MAYPENAQRLLVDSTIDERPTHEGASLSATARNAVDGITARRATLYFVASLFVCIALYLVFAVPGKWYSPLPDRVFDAAALVVARGNATQQGDELIVAPDAQARDTVVSIVTDFRAADYPLIAWIATDLPGSTQAALLWQTDYEPAQLHRVPLQIASGRPLPAIMNADRHWIGRVTGVALAIHGPLLQPVRIRGVVAKTGDVRDTLIERMQEWTALEPWKGTSINTVTGGADVQELPLPLLLVVVVALASGALAFKYRGKLRAVAPSLAIAAAAFFVVAWFVLDARWSFNLAREVRETALRYGGKNWREKHLAGEDGALFAFIEKARGLLPETPARVFVVADAHYFRGRAAFHLYPHNVWYEPYVNAVPPADRLRSGDFIVVYQRRGVQYDAAAQRLRWDGGATVPVELKLVDSGAALFVVR